MILFCRVAWMKYYDGITTFDKPRGGGAWVDEHERGGEVYNYSRAGGFYQGYVQVTGNINIARLGGDSQTDFVDGVTVVWVAAHESRGHVIVGWYNNARVYRELQDSSKGKRAKDEYPFNVMASIKDCILLHEDERALSVPH